VGIPSQIHIFRAIEEAALMPMDFSRFVRRISLYLTLLSVLGCATQPQLQQPSEPVAEKIPEEQPRKQAIPTFTYRPGA